MFFLLILFVFEFQVEELKEELDGPIHALSIVAKSPSQWEKMITAGKDIPSTPKCRGGDGSLPTK